MLLSETFKLSFSDVVIRFYVQVKRQQILGKDLNESKGPSKLRYRRKSCGLRVRNHNVGCVYVITMRRFSYFYSTLFRGLVVFWAQAGKANTN